MPQFTRNIAAAFSAVLLTAASFAHVVAIPPAQAAVILAPALA